MRLFLLAALLILPSLVFANPMQEDYSQGGAFAVYDTTIATTGSSVDTVYFGGMAVQITGEMSSNPCTISWHHDWRAIPNFGVITMPTIQSGRRKGKLFIEKTKSWPVAAGGSFSYKIPTSGMIVRGVTGVGSIHIQALIRVR